MKRVLEYIDKKNEVFARAKIFEYLADETIDPLQRLAFAPYMAHFVFSFMDINRFVLRNLQSDETLQALVNVHTFEDAHHWPWYINDLKRLGLDKPMSFTESLYFIWGDHGIHSRLLSYKMIELVGKASNKEKIMIVEAVEKTGNVFLKYTAAVCANIRGGADYEYYGLNHYECETGHHMGSSDIMNQLANIPVNDDEAKKGFALIDEIYGLYHDFVNEMFHFAKANRIEQLRNSASYSSTIMQDEK